MLFIVERSVLEFTESLMKDRCHYVLKCTDLVLSIVNKTLHIMKYSQNERETKNTHAIETPFPNRGNFTTHRFPYDPVRIHRAYGHNFFIRSSPLIYEPYIYCGTLPNELNTRSPTRRTLPSFPLSEERVTTSFNSHAVVSVFLRVSS